MFGLFKSKEIDPSLLKHNVTEAILSSWKDSNNLKYEKFDSFIRFAEMSGKNNVNPESFIIEKLRYITSIAMNLLDKTGVDETMTDDIIANLDAKVSSTENPRIKEAATGLGTKSKEYAEIRFSASPREAGRMIENKFSQESFGFTPSDDEIDRRYTLYKSLSSLERSVISEISTAIRKSMK